MDGPAPFESMFTKEKAAAKAGRRASFGRMPLQLTHEL